jgi:hypothetical protein
MAVELTDLDEELMTVPDLSIHRVQDEPSRRLWSETMALGFEIPPQVDFIRRAWTDLLERVNAETVLAYIGYLDNQPVATSLLSLGGGAAGIYGVSTIPAARRKGMGAWIPSILLHAATKVMRSVLQASGMGVVYKAGFSRILPRSILPVSSIRLGGERIHMNISLKIVTIP